MTLLTLDSDAVSVAWLAEHINDPALILLDASWFMPMLKRDGKAEWRTQTIPGALYFDFDKIICDQTSTLPHMMPDAQLFEQEVRALGVNQHSAVVVFDRLGIFSSPRVWWMFKSMGFNNIAVLDGGLNSWIDADLNLANGQVNSVASKGDFIANFQENLIVSSEQVLAAIDDGNVQIIDARAKNRFLAEVPEPRADLRSGHMPSAKNLPFSELLINGQLREVSQLSALYENLLTKQQQAIFSCGSGVTACVLALGATLCGYEKLAVYDGSWSEWGGSALLPVIGAGGQLDGH